VGGAPQAHAAVASAASSAASASKPALVDINCTDSAALEVALRKLEGIGEERAKAIAKGRPYGSPDDLVARQILPPAVYARIKSRLVAPKLPEQ
jgi:DNA uptake protein ComE-like DNA-binding protein